MTVTLRREELLALLEGDESLFEELFTAGLLSQSERETFALEDAELARLARTLVRDLDVNWPGVEIILRLRAELLEMHSQIAELCRLLRAGPTG